MSSRKCSKKISIIGAAYRDRKVPEGFSNWTTGRHWTVEYDRAYELHIYEKAKEWIYNIPAEKRYTLTKQKYESTYIRKNEIFQINKLGLTSTVPWMIAEAILENPEEIRILGCPMLAPSHRRLAPGVSWWLGIAKGRGIKISGNYNFVGTYEYGT